MTVIMLQKYILLLLLGSSIIGKSATLTISPAVVINASYVLIRNSVNLFCLDSNKFYYDAEWLNPSFQLISNETLHIYHINFAEPVSPGSYWCRNRSNHSIIAESKVIVTNNLTVIGEERIAVRDKNHALLLNCLTNTSIQQNSNIAWARVLYYPLFVITESSKYTINPFELIIHNATIDDLGKYACYANDTSTVYKLIQISAVEWQPESLSGQNQNIIMVSVSEEVILNCTASASPDPAYSWSFPDSCSSCPIIITDSVYTFTVDITSGGDYICVAKNQHGRLSISFVVIVMYNLMLIDESRTTIRDNNHDLAFICATNISIQHSNNIAWACVMNDEVFLITEASKYQINSFELIIHNATRDDKGIYACYANDTYTVYKVINISAVEWAPELLYEQTQTGIMNVSEKVILNCTVSASPDPVYSWSFPDSCSSCPHFHSKSIVFFIVTITDNGEYTCMAKNKHGNVTKIFNVHVNSKPIMVTNFTTIRKDQSISNVMLTCPVQYAYPPAEITWNIMTESSSADHVIEKNSTGNYILLNNGSLEVYHRFIYDEHHVTVTCTAANKYGSAQTLFSIWDDEYFSQVKTFVLYVGAPSCEDILNMSERLFQVLHEWFNSVCDCDGLNNLYNPQVTCVDDRVGKVTSTVHSDDTSDKTAEMLIGLAKSDIESRDPAQVEILSDWMICLSEDCGKTNGGESGMPVLPNVIMQDFTLYVKNITCNNDNKDTVFSTIQTWFFLVCSCDIINFQQFNVTCLDSTTANITIVLQSYENVTAQSMIDSVVNYMLGLDYPAVVYLQSGWVVCLNVDCEWRFDGTSITRVDNSTTTTDESDNGKSIPLVVGLAVGLILVAIIVVLLCVIVIILKRKSKWCKSKSDKNFNHHLEMMHTGIYVKSTNLIENFDTEDIISPTDQPLKNQKYDDASTDKSTCDVKITEKGSCENM